jgi:hypothetical protein
VALTLSAGCTYLAAQTQEPTPTSIPTDQPTALATDAPASGVPATNVPATDTPATDTPAPATPSRPETSPPTDTPTDSPTDTPPPTPTEIAQAWQRIPDFPPEESELTALTATSFGFVATATVDNPRGCEYGGVDGRIWTSADGLAWSTTELPESYLENIVEAGGTAYVFGSSGNFCGSSGESYVWRSTDGMSWDRSAISLEGVEDMAGIGAVGNMLIALGESYTDDGHVTPLVWTSANGVDWQQSTGGPISGVVGFDLVAAGDVVVALDSYSEIPIWQSSDRGQSWRKSEYRPQAWVQPFSGVAANGAFVAIGSVCCSLWNEEAGIALASRDNGLTWHESLPFASAPAEVVAVSEGFIAIGDETLFSADGVAWTLAAALPRLDNHAWLFGAAKDDRVVAINGRFAWLATAADLAAGASGAPTPPEMPQIGVSYPVNMSWYCGDGELDFGLRTWVPDPPFSDDYRPWDFDTGERGTLTLIGPDELRFEGRSGTLVTLRPNPVTIVNGPCA